MKILLLFFGFLVFRSFCQVVNPWVDTTDCLPTDTPIACSNKKKQCAPLSSILSPSAPAAPAGSAPSAGPSGYVATIISCANATGTLLDPMFYFQIGVAYAQGTPESLMNSVSSSDLKTSQLIRFCVLNSTGLIGTDYKFNRTALMVALSKQTLTPVLAIHVFNALSTCPEPTDYSISPLMACLRKACMDNASGTIQPLLTAMVPNFGSPTVPIFGASPVENGPGFAAGFYGGA